MKELRYWRKIWDLVKKERAREASLPRGEKALEWKLLTNIEVANFEQACEKVQWYSVRFRIETFHRILKVVAEVRIGGWKPLSD